MTNLTDEGLRELARESCVWKHEQSEVCLNCIRSFTNLKQVRDAAKKEEREKCANYVGEHWGYVIAAAIRQMDGGK